MKATLHWLKVSISTIAGIVMMVWGILFIKKVFLSLSLSKGHVAIASLILGIILILVGGRFLAKAVSHTIKWLFSH